MRAVEFNGSNITFVKPDSMTDEECSSLPAFKGTTPEGYPIIETHWLPSKEDLDAVNAGRPIVLQLLTPVMLPVAIFTIDEEGRSNQ